MDNPAAFPTFWHPDSHAGQGNAGMTIRDWFAGQALSGLTGNSDCMSDALMMQIADGVRGGKHFAGAAYAIADAMLAARKDTPSHG